MYIQSGRTKKTHVTTTKTCMTLHNPSKQKRFEVSMPCVFPPCPASRFPSSAPLKTPSPAGTVQSAKYRARGVQPEWRWHSLNNANRDGKKNHLKTKPAWIRGVSVKFQGVVLKMDLHTKDFMDERPTTYHHIRTCNDQQWPTFSWLIFPWTSNAMKVPKKETFTPTPFPRISERQTVIRMIYL